MMEFVVFFGILIVGAAVLLWRRRSGGRFDSPKAGQESDTRIRPATDGLTGVQPPSRASREEGHGKDGGG